MAAAQWMIVAAKNYTKYRFTAGNQSMKYGDVYRKENIKAQTTTKEAFFTRGHNDHASGTQGSLVYTADEDPTVKLKFDWDIPWGLGDNTLKVTAYGHIKLEKSNFSGGDVRRNTVTIEVKDDMPKL